VEQLGLVIAAIAAAAALVGSLLTGGLLLVAWLTHLHDKAVSGTSRPVIIRAGRESLEHWEFPHRHGIVSTDSAGRPILLAPGRNIVLPPNWTRENIRWVPLWFLNRAGYQTVAHPPRRMIFFGPWPRKIDFQVSTQDVPPNEPFTVPMYIHRRKGWPRRRKHVWGFGSWELSSGQKARCYNRFRIRSFEPRPGWYSPGQ
jgi:hypothetical protein